MSWTQADLIQINLQAEDSYAVIQALGKMLQDQGYVHDSFIDAVLEREKIFATGLPTPEIQVAIPHADETLSHRCGDLSRPGYLW